MNATNTLALIAGALLGLILLAVGINRSHGALEPLAQSLEDTVNINGPTVVIRNSMGGRIDVFAQEFAYIKATHKQVILDGPCASACTMVLSVPNLCATDNAMLGFHQAWMPGPYGHQPAPQGTRMMSQRWRPYVFRWLKAVGGLAMDVKWMGPQDIYKMVPRCAAL